MKNYTDADVLAYWDAHLGVQENRRREYTDPRKYILTLLHFKFGYIEEELAEIKIPIVPEVGGFNPLDPLKFKPVPSALKLDDKVI